MAQMFTIVSLRKNHEFNRYFAKIESENGIGSYEIRTDANMRYLDWINQFTMLDGSDLPFQEFPYFRIQGLDEIAKKREKRLEKAFYKFMKEECWNETGKSFKNKK